MIIRVADVQDDGLTLTSVAESASALTDPTWRLDRIHLHVVRDGDDVLVDGEIVATVPSTCGRCLEEFPVEVRAAVEARFAPRPPGRDHVELAPDDLDLDFYDNGEVDLGALVETETTLALPMKPLCRGDCRGLCPACGGNRNVVACTCQQRPPDPRLVVLRDLAARLPR